MIFTPEGTTRFTRLPDIYVGILGLIQLQGHGIKRNPRSDSVLSIPTIVLCPGSSGKSIRGENLGFPFHETSVLTSETFVAISTPISE